MIWIFIAAAAVLGYLLDEKTGWLDKVCKFCNRHPRWSKAAGITWIVLCFVKIGYLNGPNTLFSNDCPFGMDYQAVREQLDLTDEEYNKLIPPL